jgi:hypothetical protein
MLPVKARSLSSQLSPVSNARIFDVEFAPVGANNTPGDWKGAGLFTNSHSITVGDLVPGTTYVFRVRAPGTTVAGLALRSPRTSGDSPVPETLYLKAFYFWNQLLTRIH